MALTPVPWKLLDDVSIWTQHRRALPVPPAGPVSFRAASCTLCPGGCALRVRCVGARPVASVPAPGHPLGSGACALGLTLHHLAYHPLRLASPHHRVDGRLQAVSLEAAVAEIATAAKLAARQGQAVMVLDRRPGRVVSTAWRELLAALPGGVYARPADEGGDARRPAHALPDAALLGIDLERTGTLVSFGAPVLEGWGRPGRMLARRSGMRVVQVDAWRSPSAALADEWVPIRPGAEGPLALALAHVILRDDPRRAPRRHVRRSRRSRPSVPPHGPASSPPASRRSRARSSPQGPAVAVGGGDPGGGPLGPDAERAVALLDLVLGSVGVPGGIVARRPVPEAGEVSGATPASLAAVPAGSVGLALLDGADDGRALPWPMVARTLAPGALVVSLSPFDSGLARHAALLVPGPAPLETWDEVLPSPDAAVASYSLAPALLPAPARGDGRRPPRPGAGGGPRRERARVFARGAPEEPRGGRPGLRPGPPRGARGEGVGPRGRRQRRRGVGDARAGRPVDRRSRAPAEALRPRLAAVGRRAPPLGRRRASRPTASCWWRSPRAGRPAARRSRRC